MGMSKLRKMINDARDTNIEIPTRESLFKNTPSFDFGTLGMTFSQRITCMLICLLMGSISFVYAFTSLFSALFSPTKFILPYVFSNIMFFTMVGFFRGFKTY